MKSEATSPLVTEDIATFRGQLLQDFRLACLSREASLLGRKEVLGGKAKFGIFGDGKELAQLALARVARPGDWRSGYYRDQTLMLALGLIDLPGYFASLYADADVEREPTSGGRQMSGHFATRFIDADGGWLDQRAGFNSSADISPTAGQMPRLLGLAQASKVYRSLPELAAAMPFLRGWGRDMPERCLRHIPIRLLTRRFETPVAREIQRLKTRCGTSSPCSTVPIAIRVPPDVA
jgi:TPP-dependent pyruvate/acetoin dehydrogenase alpha subunit